MAASTQPDVLLAQSSCYQCIPDGMQREVAIAMLVAILSQLTATAITVQQLLDNSKCYSCVPDGAQSETQTMLLESLLIGIA